MRYVKKLAKYLLITLAVTFILVAGGIQLPPVQNFLIHKLVNTFKEQYHVNVQVNRVGLTVTGKVFVNGFLLQGQDTQTIASFRRVLVRISPFRLFKRKVLVHNLELVDGKFVLAIDSAYNSNLGFLSDTSSTTEPDTSANNGKPWSIAVNGVSLTNCSFTLDNRADSVKLDASEKKIDIDFSAAEITKLQFHIKSMSVTSGHCKLVNYSRGTYIDTSSTEPGETNLNIWVKRLRLRDALFQQYDSATGIAGNYYMGRGEILGGVVDLAKERIRADKLICRHSSVYFSVGDSWKDTTTTTMTTADEPDNSTDNWLITAGDADIGLDSLTLMLPPIDVVPYIEKMRLSDIALRISGTYQVPLFWSGEIKSLEFTDRRTGKKIKVAGKSQMSKGLMKVNEASVTMPQSEIRGNFSIDLDRNTLDDIPQMQCNLRHTVLNYNDFAPYLPPTLDSLPIKWPQISEISADLKSNARSVRAKINMNNSTGRVDFDGEMKSDSSLVSYNLNLKLGGIKADKILSDSSIQYISGTVTVTGTGLKPGEIRLNAGINMDSLSLFNHMYKKVSAEYMASGKDFRLRAGITDSLLTCKIRSSGVWANQMPDAYFSILLDKADLRRLSLIQDTILLQSYIHGRVKVLPHKSFAAYADTCAVTFITPLRKYHSTNKIIYRQSTDSTSIYLKSDLADMFLVGNQSLPEIADIVKHSVLPGLKQEKSELYNSSSFQFGIVARDLSVLDMLLPLGIKIPDKGYINGDFDGTENRFRLTGQFRRIGYSGLWLDSTDLFLDSKDNNITANLSVARFENSFRNVRNIQFSNKILSDRSTSKLSFDDENNTPWCNINVDSKFMNDSVIFNIADSALFNYAWWKINPANKILITREKKFSVEDLMATYQDKSFTMQGNGQNLNLTFKQFSLNGLTRLFMTDTASFSGVISGEAEFSDLLDDKTPRMNAHVGISSLKAGNVNIGNFDFQAGNFENPDIIELSTKLTNSGEELVLSGNYMLTNKQPINLKLNLNDFKTALISPFIKEYIDKPQGTLNGALTIGGTLQSPTLKGNISFNNVLFTVVPTNLNYSIDNQAINFEETQASFSNFRINDKNRNPLFIDGSIKWSGLSQYIYNLTLKNSKFLVYQTPKDIQYQRQNKVIVSGETKISGHNTDVDIRQTQPLRIDEGSSFFYKVSRSYADMGNRDVVEFVSGSDTTSTRPKASPVTYRFNLSANIELADNTPVFIVTDPIKRDRLDLQTGGKFSLDIRPYQSPVLVGTANINKGEYFISFANFSRRFDILQNSTISWTGDVSNPNADITASYTVRTSPPSLTGQVKTGTGSSEVTNTGTLPFLVNLSIKGNIANPTLSFSISLPKEFEGVDNGSIASKLQEINKDESKVNTYAFSLLLLGTFDLTNTGNYQISGIENTNALISRALNQFASQKVKFVNLHFNLESYNYSGQTSEVSPHNELQVTASKSFFDNRLNTKLGAQISIQNSNSKTEQQNVLQDPVQNLSPEFNIEYMLNQNKTIGVEAFRNIEYTGLVEGKVSSIGAGITVKKDFNSLRDLFLPPKKEDKGKRKEK